MAGWDGWPRDRTLPLNPQRAGTHSQNGNPQKINPESVAYFSTQNTTINSPRNHHNPTTNSPSKNHLLPPVFPKTPCKNTKNFPQKKTSSRGNFESSFGSRRAPQISSPSLAPSLNFLARRRRFRPRKIRLKRSPTPARLPPDKLLRRILRPGA